MTGWLAVWARSRLASRRTRRRLYVAGPALLAAVMLGFVVLIGGLAGSAQGNCAPGGGEVAAPAGDPRTMAEDGRYLESQGFTAIAAAGVVGNLVQENGLSPSGQGLAQWNSGWWAQASAWITKHGGDPSSAAGQLEYVAASTRDPSGAGFGFVWAAAWRDLEGAGSAQDAAMFFQNDYERCDGVTPADFGTANPNGGKCNSAARQADAARAFAALGGSSAVVSTTVAGVCVSGSFPSVGGYVNPFAAAKSLRPERIDMGVDYYGVGPILAIGQAAILAAVPGGTGWRSPMDTQACVYYQLLAGAYAGKFVFVCEDIVPLVASGQTVQAGQPIASFIASSSTGIEMGWGSGTPYTALAAALSQECPPPQDPGCAATGAGNSFNRFLVALGAHPGVPQAPGPQAMPAGYP